MKVPVFTCTQGESWSGMAISAGLAVLTNLAFYFGFKSVRDQEGRVEKRRDGLTIVFGHYQQAFTNLEVRLRELAIDY
jgi:hypothetical protein